MTTITIPPNVVEAAARAICETENGPCECLPDECGCIFWKAHARAAILAALAAWPGVSEIVVGINRGSIILPLNTENTDAEA